MKRIGYACKWLESDGTTPKSHNTGATTLTWCNKQLRSAAEEKLWNLACENIQAVSQQMTAVSKLDESLRMMRISSDLLPLYTEPSWNYFWIQPDIQIKLSRMFGDLGKKARENNIRLSFHPGQFCCLVSENSDVVNRSLQELEYHALMAAWMGYGTHKLDFKINVHLSGKRGATAFEPVWHLMTPELRNCLTIENDEFQSSLEQVLSISHLVGIVFDIHHEWIASGEYLTVDDSRIQRTIDSWQGQRPVMHLSISPRDQLEWHDVNQLPDLDLLLQRGYKRQQLRKHSNDLWNLAVCEHVYDFWDHFDIMTETKNKNLSSQWLFDFYNNKQPVDLEFKNCNNNYISNCAV